MLASWPTTRTLPLAIAVVNGDSCGLNARMYGSSDVSATLNDSSASISAVSAMRPAPDTARRGDAASSLSVISVAVDVHVADHLADAFVADEDVADGRAHVVARARRTCRCPRP